MYNKSLDSNMYNKSEKVIQEQVKFNLRRKDYAKIRAWYDEYNHNYFYEVKAPDQKQFYKQIHFRIYFSQIIFTQKFMNLNLKALFKINPKGFNIIGNIYKEKQQIFIGKTYESDYLQCKFSIQNKSIILEKEVDLFFYINEGKKKDTSLVLQFKFINQDGEQFKLGRINYNINSELKGQIVDIPIQANKQKIGIIPAILEYDSISQIKKYIPQCAIIDQETRIPPIIKFYIKAKDHHFTVQNRIKLKLNNLKIQIKQFSQFSDYLQKNINPFPTYHHELVSMEIKEFQLTIGTHNSWKFVQFEKQPLYFKLSVSTLEKDQTQQNSLILTPQLQTFRKVINKTIFDCQNQLLIAILKCKINFCLNASVIKDSKQVIQFLGWAPIVTNLSQQKVRYDILLQNNFSLPGYTINIPSNASIIKLSSQIQNVNFKDYKKRHEEKNITQKYITSQKLIQNKDFGIQTAAKNFIKRRNPTASSTTQQIRSQKNIQNLDQQLQRTLKQMQKHITDGNNRIIMKGSSTFKSQRQQKDSQINTEWDHVLNLKNKILKIGLKLKSIIPFTENTDEYYLPKQMQFKFYLLRKTISLSASIHQNYASYGMPSYLKGKKQAAFIQILFQNEQEIKKLHDSMILLEIQDEQINQLYAKGQYKASSLLHSSKNNKQNSFFKIPLKNQKNQKHGFLILQTSFSIKKWEEGNHKSSVQQISNQKIIRSLPMKQRMMMRINNYNNSNKQMKNKAIQIYKQKNHENLIQNIINQEINNEAEMIYQIGVPIYYLLQFTNQSASQNNIFTLKIQNPFVQIITNQKQYKQICQNHGFNLIPLNKIQFKLANNSPQNNYYETKIKHKTTIGILVKVLLQEWNNKIPQIDNFYIEVLRNTMPVKSFKFKLIYKEPIITQILSVYEINSHENEQFIKVNLPKDIAKKYKHFISYTKNLTYNIKRKYFKYHLKEQVKSPFAVQLLICGQLMERQKLENILVKLKILDGKQVQLQLGSLVKQVIPINTIMYPTLNTKILHIKKQSLGKNIIIQKKLYSILGFTEIQVFISSLEECSNRNILIDLFQFQGGIKYQFLFKLYCKLKKTPIILDCQNYIGQILKIKCKNNYSIPCQYFLRTFNSSLVLSQENFIIQKNSSYLIQGQINGNISQIVYIILYDSNCFVTEVYLLDIKANFPVQVIEIINSAKKFENFNLQKGISFKMLDEKD